jgi:hypothetical protein
LERRNAQGLILFLFHRGSASDLLAGGSGSFANVFGIEAAVLEAHASSGDFCELLSVDA